MHGWYHTHVVVVRGCVCMCMCSQQQYDKLWAWGDTLDGYRASKWKPKQWPQLVYMSQKEASERACPVCACNAWRRPLNALLWEATLSLPRRFISSRCETELLIMLLKLTALRLSRQSIILEETSFFSIIIPWLQVLKNIYGAINEGGMLKERRVAVFWGSLSLGTTWRRE